MSYILDKIREIISASEKSRYRISQEIGLSQAQLSRLMHGKSGLSFETLELLAECLGYKIVFEPKNQKKDGKERGKSDT